MKLLLLALFPFLLLADEPSTNLIVIDNGFDSPFAILVTGFGPFGSISNNPAERMAKLLPSQIQQTCGNPSWNITTKTLPVRPGVISESKLNAYETVISMGVDASADSIRIERYARNWYSDSSSGIQRKIDLDKDKNYLLTGPKLPKSLPAYLEGFSIILGDENSGGNYVCNDTFYRLCRDNKKGYFIHIPYVTENQDLLLSKSLAGITCMILTSPVDK